MAAVTVATVAKKVVEVLASNKKGRKFIGYVIGIAVFILCIPVIVVFSLFGWTAGADNQAAMQQAMAGAVQGHVNESVYQERLETVKTVFTDNGLPEGDIRKAQFLCLTTLGGIEMQENFYGRLLACFTGTTNEKNVYRLLEETFGIDISAEDEARLDELYGVTPVRKTDTGGGR